jgi:hypothetical protein
LAFGDEEVELQVFAASRAVDHVKALAHGGRPDRPRRTAVSGDVAKEDYTGYQREDAQLSDKGFYHHGPVGCRLRVAIDTRNSTFFRQPLPHFIARGCCGLLAGRNIGPASLFFASTKNES